LNLAEFLKETRYIVTGRQDANGDTVWMFSIPEPKNSFINLLTCFFDSESNCCLIFRFSDNKNLDKGFNEQKVQYYLYRLSQDGYLLNKILLPNSKNLNQFILPSNNLVKDVFVLIYWQYTDYYNWQKMFSSPKDVVAFSAQGEEKWTVSEKRDGNFKEFNYLIYADSYFYTIFESINKKSFLKIFSPDGLPWEIELKGKTITPIKLDKVGNIYIGINEGLKEYLYSYTSTGIFRWSIEVKGIRDFTLGTNKNIYYYNRNRNILYNIHDQKK
jgi:hypothetical protein